MSWRQRSVAVQSNIDGLLLDKAVDYFAEAAEDRWSELAKTIQSPSSLSKLFRRLEADLEWVESQETTSSGGKEGVDPSSGSKSSATSTARCRKVAKLSNFFEERVNALHDEFNIQKLELQAEVSAADGRARQRESELLANNALLVSKIETLEANNAALSEQLRLTLSLRAASSEHPQVRMDTPAESAGSEASAVTGGTLESATGLDEQLRALRQNYDAEISRLQAQNDALASQLESKNFLIERKDQLLARARSAELNMSVNQCGENKVVCEPTLVSSRDDKLVHHEQLSGVSKISITHFENRSALDCIQSQNFCRVNDDGHLPNRQEDAVPCPAEMSNPRSYVKPNTSQAKLAVDAETTTQNDQELHGDALAGQSSLSGFHATCTASRGPGCVVSTIATEQYLREGLDMTQQLNSESAQYPFNATNMRVPVVASSCPALNVAWCCSEDGDHVSMHAHENQNLGSIACSESFPDEFRACKMAESLNMGLVHINDATNSKPTLASDSCDLRMSKPRANLGRSTRKSSRSRDVETVPVEKHCAPEGDMTDRSTRNVKPLQRLCPSKSVGSSASDSEALSCDGEASVDSATDLGTASADHVLLLHSTKKHATWDASSASNIVATSMCDNGDVVPASDTDIGQVMLAAQNCAALVKRRHGSTSGWHRQACKMNTCRPPRPTSSAPLAPVEPSRTIREGGKRGRSRDRSLVETEFRSGIVLESEETTSICSTRSGASSSRLSSNTSDRGCGIQVFGNHSDDHCATLEVAEKTAQPSLTLLREVDETNSYEDTDAANLLQGCVGRRAFARSVQRWKSLPRVRHRSASSEPSQASEKKSSRSASCTRMDDKQLPNDDVCVRVVSGYGVTCYGGPPAARSLLTPRVTANVRKLPPRLPTQ